MNQLGDEHGESVDLALCESQLDNDILVLDPAAMALVPGEEEISAAVRSVLDGA